MAGALAHVARATRAVGSRLGRVFTGRNSAKEFRKEMSRSKWSGECLIPNVWRVTNGGGAQMYFLFVVHQFSRNRGDKSGGPCRYMEQGWAPEDFITCSQKEDDTVPVCSRQGITAAITEAIRDGLASTKAIDDGHATRENPFHPLPGHEHVGQELYFYRACVEDWEKLDVNRPAPTKDMGVAEAAETPEENADAEEEPARLAPGEKIKLTAGVTKPHQLRPSVLTKIGKFNFRGATVPFSGQQRGFDGIVMFHLEYATDGGILAMIEPRGANVLSFRGGTITEGPPAALPRRSRRRLSAQRPQPHRARSVRRRAAREAAAHPSPYDLADKTMRYEDVVASVRREFPDAQRTFLRSLFRECERRMETAGVPIEALTSEALEKALKDSRKQTGRQSSAGYWGQIKRGQWESNLADAIEDWAKLQAQNGSRRPKARSEEERLEEFLRERAERRAAKEAKNAGTKDG